MAERTGLAPDTLRCEPISSRSQRLSLDYALNLEEGKVIETSTLRLAGISNPVCHLGATLLVRDARPLAQLLRLSRYKERDDG